MKIVRLFDIRWDTDDEAVDLPHGTHCRCRRDLNPEEQAADLLADNYRLLRVGLFVQGLDNPKLSESGFEMAMAGSSSIPTPMARSAAGTFTATWRRCGNQATTTTRNGKGCSSDTE